jgi:hypothetical protein
MSITGIPIFSCIERALTTITTFFLVMKFQKISPCKLPQVPDLSGINTTQFNQNNFSNKSTSNNDTAKNAITTADPIIIDPQVDVKIVWRFLCKKESSKNHKRPFVPTISHRPQGKWKKAER